MMMMMNVLCFIDHINYLLIKLSEKMIKETDLIFISELIADENFSMLSKNLFDLAQAFETFLLISY
jgi:hypothetical protein